MSPAFQQFVDGPLQREPLRAASTAAWRKPEPEAVTSLLEQARLPGAQADAAQALAQRIARQLRERKSEGGRAGIVQGLLQEYALSSQEGVALMCLAEALLRIPDSETRDALIRDKISHGDWAPHLGNSPSLFVNAASWGLLLTGKLVSTHSERGLGATLGGLIRKGGEPLIRKGVDMVMRMMGQQFVTGETIALALEHARGLEAQGFVDGFAGHKLLAHHAHGHVHALADQGLAALADQAAERAPQAAFAVRGHQLAGDEQTPGGRIDEQ